MGVSRYKPRYKIFTRLKENIWGTSKYSSFNNLKWRFFKRNFSFKENCRFYRFKKKNRSFYSYNFSKNRSLRLHSVISNNFSSVNSKVNSLILSGPLSNKQLISSINSIKAKSKKNIHAVE
jgi:hypothetical protein